VPVGAPAPLVYQLQSPIPASWFPLMPILTQAGAVALVAGTVEGGPQSPSSRLVKRLSASGFELPEEEVGRAGLRLERVACCTPAARRRAACATTRRVEWTRRPETVRRLLWLMAAADAVVDLMGCHSEVVMPHLLRGL
jgi:hypothetical protein